MTRFLLALCGATMIAAAPVAQAQGISKGIGSFPTAPGQDAAVPDDSTPPSTPGRATGLLAANPASIQAAMQAEGFQAKLTTNTDGDPMITGKVSDTDYWVYFLDCVDGANCKGVQFHSGYHLDRGVTAAEMNQFNADYRYIRAYLNDQGDPRMQMDLLMRDDGMGPETFKTYLDLWRQLVGHWEKALGI